ncbi:hypothetical protein B7L88_gp079 [Rhizobium phage RHEph10]|uniref:hypothetical protein n=1 Tax=Rhizobium phage RHEph10 TaxID=1220717 RepID=UPI0002AB3C59|nr:hypothetical protein B7L88_gp079 [Rhizobium phage RHEph10]AGC36209.1 hypothetical protein RHEph10_gp166 [Rhizobium phage RHEph10]
MAKAPVYRTTKDIVIPAGTEVGLGPVTSRYLTDHGEVIIGFDKDTTGSLRFDLEEALQLGLIEKAE